MDSEGKVSVRGSELKLFITIQMQVPPKRKRLREEDNTKGNVHYFIRLVDVC